MRKLTTKTLAGNHRSRIVRKHAGHRRKVADIAVHHTKERTDGFLVGRYRIEITDVDGPPLVRMLADF